MDLDNDELNKTYEMYYSDHNYGKVCYLEEQVRQLRRTINDLRNENREITIQKNYWRDKYLED